MPFLSFEVYSNYEEVQRLRSEITMLENRLKSFGPGTSISTIRAVEAQLQKARAQFNNLTLAAANAGAAMELNIRKGVNGATAALNDLMGKLSNPVQGLAQIAGVAGLGAFLNNVVRIRGQFQLMETNINTLLGSAEKGKKMMAELTEYAKVSPLDFQGTVGAAQMMLGFGIEESKILPFMKALGDVSMGDAQRFRSLTLAFSQMSAAGKLMGQDLMQMVNAGFQPLDQLAKDTGKSIGQLKEEMSKGAISAQMVQQAFINATSEGGKFYNMSKAATATITGQMSMLGDATDLMFNDLGKQSEDAVIKVIQGATWLVENYEKVGAVLGTAIATFGVYKASAMASEFAIKAAAEDKTRAVVQGYEEEIAKMQEYNAQRALMQFDEGVRGSLQTGVISEDMAKKVQSLRDEVTERRNAAQAALDQAQSEATEAAQAVKAANDKVKANEELVNLAVEIGDIDDQVWAAEQLCAAQDEQSAAATAALTAAERANTAQRELDTVAAQADALAELQNTNAKNANTVAQNANTAATGKGTIATALSAAGNKVATVAQHMYTAAVNATKTAWNSLKVAMATNPIGLILTAVTTAIGLIMSFKDEIAELIGATDKLSEAAKEANKEIASEQANIDVLFASLNKATEGSKAYEAAKDQIIKQYGKYLKGLIDEKNNLTDVALAYRRVSEAAKDAAKARALESYTKKAADDYSEVYSDQLDNITDTLRDKVKDAGLRDTLLELIKADLADTGRLSRSTEDVLGKAFGEQRTKRDTWMANSSVVSIKKNLADIAKAQKKLDEETDKAQKKWGVATNEYEKMGKSQLEAARMQLQDQIDAGETAFDVLATDGKVIASYKTLAEAKLALSKIDGQLQTKKEEEAEAEKNDVVVKRNAAQKELREAKAELAKINAAIASGEKGKYTTQQLDAAQKRVKAAEAALKTAGGDPTGKTAKQAAQLAYEKRKAQIEEEKRTTELALAEQNRRRELEISQMADGTAKEIAQIKFDAEKKRQALIKEREKEAKRLEQYDMQQWIKSGKDRTEQKYYAQFSKEQLAKMRAGYSERAGANVGYGTQDARISSDEAKAMQKAYRSDLAAMREYLKEYGTFQQQKLAIAEEYAAKIAAASTEGEKRTLAAQRDNELRDVEAKAVTAQIDWYSVFDNVGVVMRGQLEPIYRQLQEYVKSDAFRKSGADNQSTVVNAMENLRKQLGENQGWRDLAKAMSDYQASLDALRVATENDAVVSAENARLMAAVADANADLDAFRKANPEAGAEQMQPYVDAVQTATANLDAYAATVTANNAAMKEAQDKVQSSGSMLSITAKNVARPVSDIYTFLSGAGLTQLAELWGAFDQLKGGIEALKGLKAAGEAGKDVSEAGEELADGAEKAGSALPNVMTKSLTDGMQSAGVIGQIISAVMSILDILKDGVGTLVSSVIDTVLNAISGIINNVLSGEMFRQIGESLYTGIAGVFKSIFTVGGLFDWMGGGDSDPELERDIERLTASNEALRNAIDDLADEMGEAKIADIGSIYEQQKKNLEQSLANTQEMMRRSGAAYSNGTFGIGGTHSSNKKINEAMSASEWAQVSKAAGVSVRSASDFWNLTSEQMAKVAKDAPTMYAKIKQYAAKGYKDAAQYMDDYIAYYKELEELQDAYRESLTDVSFDSVKDEFKSTLLDMESSSADFADNFEAMMRQAVINGLMNDKYNDMIKEWYESFAEAMDNGDLSSTEQSQLRKRWDEIVGQAVDERDRLMETMGWSATSYSQRASSSGFQAMSEDTGQELNGRFTALQIAGERIAENTSASTLSLAEINDGLLLIATEYSRYGLHYENVERQLAKMYIELQSISENTGAIVQPIHAMQADIAEIKRITKEI